jgi:hypothetical protein
MKEEYLLLSNGAGGGVEHCDSNGGSEESAATVFENRFVDNRGRGGGGSELALLRIPVMSADHQWRLHAKSALNLHFVTENYLRYSEHIYCALGKCLVRWLSRYSDWLWVGDRGDRSSSPTDFLLPHRAHGAHPTPYPRGVQIAAR